MTNPAKGAYDRGQVAKAIFMSIVEDEIHIKYPGAPPEMYTELINLAAYAYSTGVYDSIATLQEMYEEKNASQ